MHKSRAFRGGRLRFNDLEEPTDESDVLEIVQRFVREKFDFPEIADEIESTDKHFISNIVESEEESCMLFSSDGELIANGEFAYQAKNDSTQVIWSNKFEIRRDSGEIVVKVSDWFGPTVDSWNQTYNDPHKY